MSDPDSEDDPLAQAYNRGLVLEKAGELDGAASAYREALALDPADHGGVSVRLAAIGRGPVPDAAPDAYVATLFDQNAAAFDDMLVEQLGYAVPMLLRERFAALNLGPFDSLLDLGCGTGLTGSSLSNLVTHTTGVDLSEQMLDEAYERECYDALFVAEAVAFLQEAGPDEGAPWDLIAATDVLPYIGDLDPFFAGAATKLTPNGLLAVSAETLLPAQMQEQDFTVTAKHRFAHSAEYLDGLVQRHGFKTTERLPIDVRYDEGEPIPGYLMLAIRQQ